MTSAATAEARGSDATAYLNLWLHVLDKVTNDREAFLCEVQGVSIEALHQLSEFVTRLDEVAEAMDVPPSYEAQNALDYARHILASESARRGLSSPPRWAPDQRLH